MLKNIYKFGLEPIYLSCFGGGSAPAPPPPPPPPPQLAKIPDAGTVRASTSSSNIATGGGAPQTTLLTGGSGDALTAGKLGKKTLLGG